MPGKEKHFLTSVKITPVAIPWQAFVRQLFRPGSRTPGRQRMTRAVYLNIKLGESGGIIKENCQTTNNMRTLGDSTRHPSADPHET
jgi:hypothetical protein